MKTETLTDTSFRPFSLRLEFESRTEAARFRAIFGNKHVQYAIKGGFRADEVVDAMNGIDVPEQERLFEAEYVNVALEKSVSNSKPAAANREPQGYPGPSKELLATLPPGTIIDGDI